LFKGAEARKGKKRDFKGGTKNNKNSRWLGRAAGLPPPSAVILLFFAIQATAEFFLTAIFLTKP
jgi:hypothetical protein